MVRIISLAAMLALAQAYAPPKIVMTDSQGMNSRRAFVSQGVAFTLGTASASFLTGNKYVEPANAVGPVKIKIINPTYSAAPCPPSKPIPVRLVSTLSRLSAPPERNIRLTVTIYYFVSIP